ncbi:tripartite tricarboxylate transporter substrate binding protein [Roseomonas sp. NAR14]|uniref:Tripartite tricarboxylate transporter substrate binding protein n=1 Tax=Roseomonas acroporae TaxID=2937791 RepID=A0A9X1YFF7_9PROT|nr:tripartite tricarboxylate transporter substrate binding protein [Roseomonas acroporae]MCK8787682.1 tripartite tricarboxylate transporter substrate binding protein [Roseomonas acroporae]
MIGRRRLGAAVLALAAARAGCALAQEGLPRTVTLVVPFSAGSVVDIMARPFAEALRAALGGGTSVVVLNREGGGGAVGAAAVATARPDGGTLYFGPSGMLTTLPFLVPGLPYAWGALEPVCQTFENIFVVAVPADSPYHSLAALLAAGKARPEDLAWGDAGPGTVGNLITLELSKLSGARMTHVPYRSSSQMILDTQSGAVAFSIPTYATVRGQNLRLLAVAAEERQPTMPEVPTLRELGFDVDWRGFGGIMAPRGTPPALLRRLEAACLEAVRSESYRAMAANTGQIAPPLDAAAFGARLQAEYRNADSFLREMGLAR